MAYIIFYQGGPIDHDTHIPGPVAKSSAESEYNAACTSGMALAHFRILIHELLNKDPDIVPEEAPLIVLDRKSAMCMSNNGKDTKQTGHIASRMHFCKEGKNNQYAQDWLVWARSKIGINFFQECWWVWSNTKDEIYYGTTGQLR